ncbi:hypothetical protein CANCADRAFT_57477 [Tortispora caseinolytica NRRL Y-17796]|uniref:Uncharacterized protein n=1 Tax=Tortispora caseinolytica NRRL Y-17796 TaxID=767744 RepID=A0A1E4THA6_9ASCO|nr:hypothetical protein CANCADRAFT_57477 [Tortispora caseinolytica NRRL Y-17796]
MYAPLEISLIYKNPGSLRSLSQNTYKQTSIPLFSSENTTMTEQARPMSYDEQYLLNPLRRTFLSTSKRAMSQRLSIEWNTLKNKISNQYSSHASNSLTSMPSEESVQPICTPASDSKPGIIELPTNSEILDDSVTFDELHLLFSPDTLDYNSIKCRQKQPEDDKNIRRDTLVPVHTNASVASSGIEKQKVIIPPHHSVRSFLSALSHKIQPEMYTFELLARSQPSRRLQCHCTDHSCLYCVQDSGAVRCAERKSEVQSPDTLDIFQFCETVLPNMPKNSSVAQLNESTYGSTVRMFWKLVSHNDAEVSSKRHKVFEDIQVPMFSSEKMRTIHAVLPTKTFMSNTGKGDDPVYSPEIIPASLLKEHASDFTLNKLCSEMSFDREGDNHVSYLISMLRYYLAAVVTNATKQEVAINYSHSLDYGNCHYCKKKSDWKRLRSKYKEHNFVFVPVHALGKESYDMAHFLVTCTHSGTSKYPCYLKDSPKTKTVYDTLNLDFSAANFIVVNDDEIILQNYNQAPEWPGDHIRIRKYIERYAQIVGVEDQISLALEACETLVYLKGYEDVISIPAPRHYADIPVIDQCFNGKYTEQKNIGAVDFNLLSISSMANPLTYLTFSRIKFSLITTALAAIAEALVTGTQKTKTKDESVKACSLFCAELRAIGENRQQALLEKVVGIDLTFLQMCGTEFWISLKLAQGFIKEPQECTIMAAKLLKNPLHGTLAWALSYHGVKIPKYRGSLEKSESIATGQDKWLLEHLGYSQPMLYKSAHDCTDIWEVPLNSQSLDEKKIIVDYDLVKHIDLDHVGKRYRLVTWKAELKQES